MQCTTWVPVQDIERAYNSNPYHNNIHAADVTQTLGCFLANDDFAQKLTDLEVAAMIFATCIHDVGHPGQCLPHVCYSCVLPSHSLFGLQLWPTEVLATFRCLLLHDALSWYSVM